MTERNDKAKRANFGMFRQALPLRPDGTSALEYRDAF